MLRDKIPERDEADIQKVLSQVEEQLRDAIIVLTGFRDRLSLGMAESRFNIPKGELRGAIERGEIESYRMSETRYYVSPAQVAEWIAKHKCYRNAPLPS